MDGQVSMFGQDWPHGRTCLAPIVRETRKEAIFRRSSRRSYRLKNHTFMLLDLRPGAGNLLGPCWEYDPVWLGPPGTLNTSECPSDVVESSLSQILEDIVPSKYYLTRKACLGILRRARERGKPLPPQLEAALKAQAGLTVCLTPIKDPPLAFHMNQRDEAIDLGETAGALMATSNMQMQTFVTAFAANQRDEVRDLHDVAGALSAQPGMKQQTFIADCLTPWDTQQNRIYTPDGTSPTLAGADGGGGRNPGGLVFAAGFCAGAGPSAGGVGYHEEVAPTLKASDSVTNMVPSVLCLNDQGGSVMECSEDVSGTLRAQEHGHQPLVFENHGVDARYTGPRKVAPTLSARAGTGGNNLPLVEVFSRQRVDKFQADDVVSTQSARQHKDATDLVYQQTVGALTTSGSKGPNSQYVSQDKLVVDGPLLIRRLIPKECEKLQGYPPGWTDLPGASDSSRYKALGNSVAIPCVEFLLRGMALVLRGGQSNAK